MKVVIVTGARDWTDMDAVWDALDELKPGLVVQGLATGVDENAVRWAIARKVPVASFPADWERFGRKAGPIRNRQMLDAYPDATVLAFPGPKSRGTWDCVRAAKDRGMGVIVRGSGS